MVSRKLYRNTLSPKLEKTGPRRFLEETRGVALKKFWTVFPIPKSQVRHLCLPHVSKKSDNSEGQIQNTDSIILFLKKESLQLVIVA